MNLMLVWGLFSHYINLASFDNLIIGLEFVILYRVVISLTVNGQAIHHHHKYLSSTDQGPAFLGLLTEHVGIR